MKKLVFTIILLLCTLEGMAQLEYIVTFKLISVKSGGSECSTCVFDAYVESTNGNNKSYFFKESDTQYYYKGKELTKEGTANEMKKIVIDKTPLGSCDIFLSFPCMNEEKTVQLPIYGYYITYSVTVRPKSIPLNYYDRGKKLESYNELYIYDKINFSLEPDINLTTCYSGTTTKANGIWEFYIGGRWYKLTDNALSLSNITGEQMLDRIYYSPIYSPTDPYSLNPRLKDFWDVAKNQSIKARFSIDDCGCGDMVSNEVILVPRITAPTIKSVKTVIETCYNANNGKIILYFNRKLHENEILDVILSNEEAGTGKVVHVPDFSDSCVIDYLSSGTYDIILSGKYPYYDTDNTGNPTYVQDDAHKISNLVLYPHSNISISAYLSDPYCYGSSDGEITISATGGTSEYYAKYTDNDSTDWFNRYVLKTISGLSSGVYNIQIRDRNGCYPKNADDSEKILKIELTEPDAPVKLSIRDEYGDEDIQEPSGYSLANGHIKIYASGGVSPYTYEWTKNGTSFTPSSPDYADNLGAGTYFIKIKDSNFSKATEANCRGCFDTITIVLKQPDPLEIEVTEHAKIKCKGETNGSIMATVKGGVKPYTKYKLTTNGTAGSEKTFPNNGDNLTIEDLPAGEYKITVIDVNNNTTTSSPFVLAEPSLLNVSDINITEPKCNGNANGSAKVTVVGGTAPYTYSWKFDNVNISANSDNISGLRAGNISVKVTDNHGCYVDKYADISQPAELTADYAVTLPLAYNTSDGKITITANGGTAPYSYKLLDNSSVSSNIIAGLPARDNPYTVTVVDAKGCITTLNDIYIIYPLNVDITEEQAILCYDGKGALKAVATGGVTGKTYQWYQKTGTNYTTLTGKTDATLSNIVTGTYRVEVKDSRGNTASKDIDFSQPDELKATSNISLPSAYNASDGKITITPNGGTPPYSYLWYYNNSTSNTLANIPANDNPYKVKITDNNQCSIELNTRIIYELTAKITVENPIFCYGGTGTLKATGTGGVGTNYAYQWHRITDSQKTPCGNGALLQGISVGKYSVTVTDNENNTKESEVFELVQPTQLTAEYTVSLPSAHNASDGKIEIAPSGGTSPYSYVLDGNQVTNPVAGLPARENPYIITVKDANQCSTELNPHIIYPLNVNVNETSSIVCHGGKGILQATATGGVGTNYSYQWYSINQDNTETPISSATGVTLEIITGKYRVKVTDKEGVSANSNIIEILQPDMLTAEYTVAQPSTYNAADGIITVIPSGGVPPYSYTLDGVSATNPFSGISARYNQYVVTITDAKGCKKILDNIYAFYYPMEITIVEDNAIKCFGEKGVLRAEVTGGANKTYNWYVKDASNNFVLLSGQISATLTNVAAGTYRVRVKDSNDTIKYEDFELAQPTKFTAKFEKQLPSAYNASDGAILILPSGGVPPYSYSWNYNNSTANPLEDIPARDNPYEVKASDANGCSVRLDIEMIYPLAVKAEVAAPIPCHNGTGTLKAIATGGMGTDYSYEWYRVEDAYYEEPLHVNNAVLTNAGAGKYRVKATDKKNTTEVSEIIELNQPEQLTAEYGIILPTAYNASDGKITITPSGGVTPYSYSWEYNNSTANPLENIPANDNPYKVKIADANGCNTTLEPRVIYPLSVEIAVMDSISCYGGGGTLKARATGGVGTNYSYKWYKISSAGTAQLLTAENSNILANAVAGTYRADAIDMENNLKESENLALPQPAQLTAEYKITLPSAYNASDGEILITSTGGVSPYSYTWDYNNSTANPLENIPANDEPYKVVASDAKGCTKELYPRVIYPLEVKISIVDSIPCHNGTGTLKAFATGGVGTNYSYLWYRINQDATETEISFATNGTLETATGKYRVKTTDSENNTAISDILELPHPDLLTAKYTIALPSTHDASDGRIEIVPTGGVAPYLYSWNYNNATTNPLEDVPADDNPYKVTVTDVKACSLTLDDIYVIQVSHLYNREQYASGIGGQDNETQVYI